MDRNTITALVLTLLLIVVYMQFMAPKPPAQTTPPGTQPTNVAPAETVAAEPAQPSPQPVADTAAAAAALSTRVARIDASVPRVTGALYTLSNELLSVEFAAYAGDLFKLELARTPLVQKGPIDTACAVSNSWRMPLRLLPLQGARSTQSFQTTQATARELSFAGELAPGLELRKHYRLPTNSYILEAEFTFKNTGGDAISLSNEYALMLGSIARVAAKKDRYAKRGCDLVLRDTANGKTKLKHFNADGDDEVRHVAGPIDWCGVRNKYFTHVLVPENDLLGVDIISFGSERDRNVSVNTQAAFPVLAPGGEYTWRAILYVGPIATEYLRTIGPAAGKSDHFNDILNLGWSAFLAKPILVYGLKGLYGLVGNYGLAIVIITLIIKIITWPLQTKSFKSMQAMQKLQPEITALREKYSKDPKKLQEETMLLYRKHGVNPLGGCLPLLLQLPIFIALYNALSHAVELWGASFLWISDLSMPDTVATLPFEIPILGDGVNPLPIMMTAASIGQQLLTPHTGDKSQQKMMFLLPAVFMFIFYNMPSGLVLYWFVNQVLTMGQMFYLHYVMKPKMQKQTAN